MDTCAMPNPILVIDDEPAILKLMARILSKNGHAVDTASNGDEGINKIDANIHGLF